MLLHACPDVPFPNIEYYICALIPTFKFQYSQASLEGR